MFGKEPKSQVQLPVLWRPSVGRHSHTEYWIVSGNQRCEISYGNNTSAAVDSSTDNKSMPRTHGSSLQLRTFTFLLDIKTRKHVPCYTAPIITKWKGVLAWSLESGQSVGTVVSHFGTSVPFGTHNLLYYFLSWLLKNAIFLWAMSFY